MDIKEITTQTNKINNDFLTNAELLMKLNNSFLKNIDSHSRKSISVNFDKHQFLSKISDCETIKKFLERNKHFICCIIDKYIIMRLENGL